MVHPRKEREAPLPPVPSAPIVSQNNAPMTPETVAPQASATTTTSTFVPTTPLQQPPLGPRPPTGPKNNNMRNRGRPVDWKRNSGMVDISPEKPEHQKRPSTSKPDGNSRHTTNKFHRTTQKSARQRLKTKPSDAQTVQQSRAMKSHPPAQPKHDRLLFKRPQISNTEMIYPTIDHGKIMDQQDDQSVEEETYDYMHGEEIFIFDMDLGEDDDAMNDGKKPAKATCEASRAPSSEQNNAPMTPETVAPQASATTTASTFVTTTPLQQPPLGPRQPTGPKKNNIRNRGRPVDWKRNSGMVDISPEKPELISFNVPPVLAPRPPVQAPRPPVLASRPPTSKPDGNRKHANLAPRNPTSKPDGNRRHANLAPRPPTSKPDGNRKHANLAARPPTSKPDGNRRHANLAPRPPTSKPDGNRKHANLAPRHPTSKPDDNRRHANPAPRPPTSKPDGNSKHTTNKFHRTTQKSARQRQKTKPSDAQTVQQSRAMKSHPPAQPKHDRLLFKRPQISNTEMIYPTTDHGTIMGRQDDQSVQEETYDYMHGEEIFIFDMDLGEDDDAMNDGKKPAQVTCEASRAPSNEKPTKVTF
ncbi:proteoglycan 4-like [Strongylocentrotus purpuratus]|uniref:Uncharacterized protein n=1 Tax=Strongylocentrotus purpuratus TaxID=7668 RepID=A0A7M7PHB7_STRPU|nr:proteoglycan 4-like [Strongylocentrotus purpuratus]